MPRKRKQDQAGAEERGPALKGVNRALDVLEYIATHPGRATDIAEALNVSWATLHRTLTQLEVKGFLKRDPGTSRYNIGARTWLIGTSYLSDHPILEVAQPYLDALAEKEPYTIQLSEWSGRYSVVLWARSPMGKEITKASLGFHFPLHCGSKGQVVLAHLPTADIEAYLAQDLEALTPETVTDPDELREILAEIRHKGWRLTAGDVQAFTASVGTPIFGRRGEVLASVCFITKRSEFADPARVEAAVETLQRTTSHISVALGWKPGVFEPR